MTTSFHIVAERCPGVLCRLLGLFAQQDRIVQRAEAVDTGQSLRITIEIGGLDAHRAEIIAERMRSMVRVRRVALDLARPEGRPHEAGGPLPH